MIDFSKVTFPAFIVVYATGKSSISAYNRSTYDDHFGCDVCQNPDEAKRLLEGYQGDERYKEASNNILELERKLGLEEGESKCIEE